MLGFLIRRRTARAVRVHISEAGLPADIARCIELVARATRLRRDEQLDVAAELVSHFREGIAAGKDASRLIADFGDVRQTARDIRRATIAKRNPVDRAITAMFTWTSRAAAVAGAAYLVSACVLYFREPTISFDGRAAIEARRIATGAEGRAIDLYREAFAGPDGYSRAEEIGARIAEVETLVTRAEYDEEARVRAREGLAALAGELSTLRRLRERPLLAMPLAPTTASEPELMRFFHGDETDASLARLTGNQLVDTSMLGVLLPHLATTRAATRLLVADAALAAHDGRIADFMGDIEAALAAARHSGEDGFLIGLLVECAQRTVVAQAVVSALENHGERFDDASLARLRDRMADNRCDITRGFEAEEMLVLDVLQRVYSDDGNGDGVLLVRAMMGWEKAVPFDPSTRGDSGPGLVDGALRSGSGSALAFLASPLAATLAPSRAEVRDGVMSRYGRIRDAALMPDPDAARRELLLVDRELEERMRTPWAVLEWIVPGLTRTALQSHGLRSASDAAVAAIALEQFRRKEARWPSDLAELERFVGRRLGGAGGAALAWNYAVVDGRPLLYDAGVDLIDDRAHTLVVGTHEERLSQLSGVPGDGSLLVGLEGRRTLRTQPTFEPTSPLRPGCIMPATPGGGSVQDGDVIRVWWKSRACGGQREVPACE